MGAWIEIGDGERIIINSLLSLPTWERGLKYSGIKISCRLTRSLPTWERGLKLFQSNQNQLSTTVAPYMGAWIEILHYRHTLRLLLSLPTWERGLKFKY